PTDNVQPGVSTLNIALSQETATRMNATVGSILTTGYSFSLPPYRQVLKMVSLHVVGIFNLKQGDDPYWHGNTYQSVARGLSPGLIITALASNNAMLSLFDTAFAEPQINGTSLDAP